MKSDISWKAYFSDDERYADIINGIAFGGVQEVSGDNGLFHAAKEPFL